MPDTIKEVGKYAFASNMYMTNIKLSASLKYIPEGMLAFCGKLKELDVPPSVKSIGKNSFDYVKLRKIIIPASVQKTVPPVGSAFFSPDVLWYTILRFHRPHNPVVSY